MEKCRVFSFINNETKNKAYVIIFNLNENAKTISLSCKAQKILFTSIGKPLNTNNVIFYEEANGKIFKNEDESLEFILKQRQLDYENGIESYNLGNMFINTVDNTVFFEEM